MAADFHELARRFEARKDFGTGEGGITKCNAIPPELDAFRPSRFGQTTLNAAFK
jgi:hypothetical protein